MQDERSSILLCFVDLKKNLIRSERCRIFYCALWSEGNIILLRSEGSRILFRNKGSRIFCFALRRN